MTAFTTNIVDESMYKKNVQLVHIATAAPRANGKVERVNPSITSMLAILAPGTDQWVEVLQNVEFIRD